MTGVGGDGDIGRVKYILAVCFPGKNQLVLTLGKHCDGPAKTVSPGGKGHAVLLQQRVFVISNLIQAHGAGQGDIGGVFDLEAQLGGLACIERQIRDDGKIAGR